MTKTKRTAGTDSYLKLVRRFSLRIHDDTDHAQATRIIQDLMGTRLDSGQSDYLKNLITIVAKYEEKHHAPRGDLCPRDALQALMEANGLTQADMGKIIGSTSAVSMFMKGRRELSKANIRTLADRFKVNPGLFL